MFEVDFLPVGDKGNSGDAICARFTDPVTGNSRVIVVDAGYQDDGDALVAHVRKHYQTDTVDLAILTHPDGDHIGGMGTVVRELNVTELWLHNIGAHGGSPLPAAKAVDDLISVATSHGADVREPWSGAQRFNGAVTVIGPSKSYYEELVAEQVAEHRGLTKAATALREAARGLAGRVAGMLGTEIPFEAKEVNARNNSSMLVLLKLDGGTKLLTADAGVRALSVAWDYAESNGLAETPNLVQLPHHGSRRNCSSSWLDRLLGPTGQTEGVRNAFVSCVKNSDKHPSGKVVNAHKRRGCYVAATAGGSICHKSNDAPARVGWGPIAPLGPMVEEDD